MATSVAASGHSASFEDVKSVATQLRQQTWSEGCWKPAGGGRLSKALLVGKGGVGEYGLDQPRGPMLTSGILAGKAGLTPAG